MGDSDFYLKKILIETIYIYRYYKTTIISINILCKWLDLNPKNVAEQRF